MARQIRIEYAGPLNMKGSNRRLKFELGAWFEGACGFALVLALSQMMEHGLGPFGRADLHPRRNPLDRQGRFAPQPDSDGQTESCSGREVLKLTASLSGRKTRCCLERGCPRQTHIRNEATGTAFVDETQGLPPGQPPQPDLGVAGAHRSRPSPLPGSTQRCRR